MTRAIVKRHSYASIGSITESMLSEAEFQSSNGTGWVLMDGRNVTGSAYHTLTGNTNIPDGRGQFLRCKNNGRSDGQQDPSGERALGSAQIDDFKAHTHPDRWIGVAGAGQTGYSGQTGNIAALNSGSTGGLETRPKNISVNFFIRINE